MIKIELEFDTDFLKEAYYNFFESDTYELNGLHSTTTCVIDDVFSEIKKIVESNKEK